MLTDAYTATHLFWIGLSVLIMGATKGGFPAGPLAMPLLILMWPDQANAARSVVGFMLPLLCVMDVFAIAVYRRHIRWDKIAPLAPGTLLGVLIASALFLSEDSAVVYVSDRWLKLIVGVVGLAFVAYQATRKWLLPRLGQGTGPGPKTSLGAGLAAGAVSTLTHAAGPIAQMYFLPLDLGKMGLAGTMAGFFFALNLVKLPPFWLLGRLETGNLALAAVMLPLIPIGVGVGYLLVRLMRGRSYVALIYGVLLFTSALLVVKAFSQP